jgi:broad specificity phosphatase PhoE
MADMAIHLFRHAEAVHNAECDESIRDPLLTEKGKKQAQRILKTYQFLNQPALILTSPLRRAIQTVLQAFHPSFNDNAAKLFPTSAPRIIALPHLQEVSQEPCDTGSSLVSLKSDYGEYVEFPEECFPCDDWFQKDDTCFANENSLLSARAEFVREYILQQSGEEIIVVTHGDFSHFLVNRWLYGPGCGTLFNGLQHACGTPLAMVLKEKTGDSEYEMTVEVPAWFGR